MDIKKFKENCISTVNGIGSFCIESTKGIGSVISGNAKKTIKNIKKDINKK